MHRRAPPVRDDSSVNRGLRIASVALITAGLVVIADVVATLAWKEPISSAYGSIQQQRAEDELADLESRFPARPDLRKVARVHGVRRKVRGLAGLFAQRIHAPLPGAGGTTAFAGHRTTYLAPFRHLDALDPGDEIDVEMPYASFKYRVERIRIVDPSDVGIVRDVGHEELVLTACHPLYSASQRIAAFARLARVSFFALGRGRWSDP